MAGDYTIRGPEAGNGQFAHQLLTCAEGLVANHPQRIKRHLQRQLQFRSILQFAAAQPILPVDQARSILRREVV
jgi:3-deoxy-D-arabino-heptulosonate 7-phosphate (DAHP) synthase class II